MPAESAGSSPNGLTGVVVTIAELKREVQGATQEIVSLTRILRGANGNDSLIVRIALLEQALVSSTASLQDLRKALEARQAEDQKGKWQLVGVVIAGVMALLSALFTALLALKK